MCSLSSVNVGGWENRRTKSWWGENESSPPSTHWVNRRPVLEIMERRICRMMSRSSLVLECYFWLGYNWNLRGPYVWFHWWYYYSRHKLCNYVLHYCCYQWTSFKPLLMKHPWKETVGFFGKPRLAVASIKINPSSPRETHPQPTARTWPAHHE